MTTPTYYTPELEEFCIGFLYEYKWNSWNGYFEKTDEWIKEEFLGAGGSQLNEETEIDCIEECIKKGTLRVKHLDREDIEGEGWATDESRNALGALKFVFLPQPEPNTMTFFGVLPYVIYFHQGYVQLCKAGTDESVLQLKILNLTEFRKLMKQLRIKKP